MLVKSLKNSRVVAPRTGFVRQTLHYYPDGVTQDKSVLPSVQKYKYNGKELDRMHGLDWYDYGARQYDPTIGQFTSMDPLCEKYYYISPYAYCAGNPVKYTDPSGELFGFTILNAVTDFLLNIGMKGVNFSDFTWKRTVNSWKIDMGMFKGSFGQVMNKWTWGAANSLVGNLTSQLFNTIGQVDRITDMDGMIALSGAFKGSSACTIGHYSLGPKGYKATWKDNLFVHEYGHYIQTQRMGVFMFPVVAIPSLFSAAHITSDGGGHRLRWFEQDASATAAHYFDKHYGSGVEGYSSDSSDYFQLNVFYGIIRNFKNYTNPRNENGYQDQFYELKNPTINMWDLIII